MISWYIASSFMAATSAEEVADVVEAVDQRVHLAGRGVQVERRPGGRRNSVPQADRPRAVVADPDRDALLVEDLADVVRVDVTEREGDRRAAVDGRARADDPQIGHLVQALDGVGGDRVLVRGDLVHADRRQVVDGGAEA